MLLERLITVMFGFLLLGHGVTVGILKKLHSKTARLAGVGLCGFGNWVSWIRLLILGRSHPKPDEND
jgi:hypothetical protein